MAKSLGHGKLDAWRNRFARFEASGLTVAAFCRKEKVSEARFYYWSRRVREAGPASHESTMRSGEATSTSSAIVEVLLGDQMTIRLPATDPVWVASVLMNLERATRVSDAQPVFERLDLCAAAAVA